MSPDPIETKNEMEMVTRRLLAIGGALAFGAVLALAAMLLNYSGLCFQKMRYLNEREFLQIAAEDAIRSDSAKRVWTEQETSVFSKFKIIPYESAADLMKWNPGCCKIVRHDQPSDDPPIHSMSRVFGIAAEQVIVSYFQNYVDENGAQKSDRRRHFVTIDNCGRTR